MGQNSGKFTAKSIHNSRLVTLRFFARDGALILTGKVKTLERFTVPLVAICHKIEESISHKLT